jgi:hypothetical protein
MPGITIRDPTINTALKNISIDLSKKSKFKKTKMDALRYVLDGYKEAK